MNKADLIEENESFKDAVEKIKELLAGLPCDEEFDSEFEDTDSEDE